jgi:hypothetical protein
MTIAQLIQKLKEYPQPYEIIWWEEGTNKRYSELYYDFTLFLKRETELLNQKVMIATIMP